MRHRFLLASRASRHVAGAQGREELAVFDLARDVLRWHPDRREAVLARFVSIDGFALSTRADAVLRCSGVSSI